MIWKFRFIKETEFSGADKKVGKREKWKSFEVKLAYCQPRGVFLSNIYLV